MHGILFLVRLDISKEPQRQYVRKGRGQVCCLPLDLRPQLEFLFPRRALKQTSLYNHSYMKSCIVYRSAAPAMFTVLSVPLPPRPAPSLNILCSLRVLDSLLAYSDLSKIVILNPEIG